MAKSCMEISRPREPCGIGHGYSTQHRGAECSFARRRWRAFYRKHFETNGKALIFTDVAVSFTFEHYACSCAMLRLRPSMYVLWMGKCKTQIIHWWMCNRYAMHGLSLTEISVPDYRRRSTLGNEQRRFEDARVPVGVSPCQPHLHPSAVHLHFCRPCTRWCRL